MIKDQPGAAPAADAIKVATPLHAILQNSGIQLAQYAHLLADSTPLPAPPNGRRDLGALYWPQKRLQPETADAASPFAKYAVFPRGEVYASYAARPWVRVLDLAGRVACRDSAKYERGRNKMWVREHDAWKRALVHGGPAVARLLPSKSAWLESRVFSIHLEIGRLRARIAQLENARRRRGRDVFGLPRN